MTLFRILVTLKDLSAMFGKIAHFINQSLVCPFQTQADYTGLKDSSPQNS